MSANRRPAPGSTGRSRRPLAPLLLSAVAVRLDDVDLRIAARDVISILARCPQPPVALLALRVSDSGDDWHDDGECEPIGYLEFGRLLREAAVTADSDHPLLKRARPRRRRFLGPVRTAPLPAATPQPAPPEAGRAELHLPLSGDAIERWAKARAHLAPTLGSPQPKAWNPMNPQVRDGLGGRQVRNTAYDREKQIALFYERYGQPLVDRRDRGRRLIVWQVDPASQGAMLIRISSEDVKGGMTVELQLTAASKVIDEQGLGAPRYVVVATEMRATLDYDTRIDLHWVVERFGRDIRWVVAREPDRVSRHESVYRFYEAMRKHKVAMYYAFWVNGRVNWEEHRFLLNMAHAFAVNEGQLIARRMLTPTVENWLGKGKGMPGAKRMGFRRDEENYLVVDEAAWPKMTGLHQRYYDAANEGRPLTLEQLTEEFNDQHGVCISVQKVHDILTDRIYNDGEWHATFAGYRVWCRPVPLFDPVPDHVFQRNQELLRLRKGHNEVTPEGEYLLNVVPFLHAECMHTRVGSNKKETPRLRRYNSGNAPSDRYYHFPHPRTAGGPHCKGLSVPGEVEAVVVCAVRDLVASRELQDAYAEAVFAEKSTAAERPSEAQLRAARLKVQELETRLRNLLKHAPGAPGPYEEWSEMQWQGLHEAYTEALAAARSSAEDLEERALVVPAELQAMDDVLEGQLAEVIASVLTVYTPQDADHRIARAALFRALVSCVILHTTDAGWYVEIQGPFFPNHQRLAGAMSPVQAAKEELRDLEMNGLLALPGTHDQNQAVKEENSCLTAQNAESPSHHRSCPETALRGEPLQELVTHLRRYEPVPSSFDAYREQSGLPRVNWVALPHHGPAWRTPKLALPWGRRPRTQWRLSELMDGLRLAVRALGPTVSLTTDAYAQLQRTDPRIPAAPLVARKAKAWGTTPDALRARARADIAAELARDGA